MTISNYSLSLAAAVGLVTLAGSAHGAIILYSSTFGGSSGSDLNGQAVDTSGATAAQHLQYGTTTSTTWAANTRLKADGSVTYTTGTERAGATVNFTPQNGYVYTLTMTTNYSVSSGNNDWFGMGFFKTPNYTDNPNTVGGGTVWSLTRPGSANANGDQVAHFNLNGGAGNQNGSAGAVNDPAPTYDTTAPSTLTMVLDTTAGTGDWSATYYQGSELLGTVADLGAVVIESVGIGTNLTLGGTTGRFQSFELSVVPEPSGVVLPGLGLLGLALRRRR